MRKKLTYMRGESIARREEAAGNIDDAANRRIDAQHENAISTDIRDRGTALAARAEIAKGEVVPTMDPMIRDTLLVPDLAAVEASLDRTRLMVLGGTDAVALALDAANSINAANSLEKMLAHQLAVVHKIAMEQIAQGAGERDELAAARRYKTASRFIANFQQGLLTLQRMRHGGQQNITVQHVHIASGAQAIVGVQARGGGNEER